MDPVAMEFLARFDAEATPSGAVVAGLLMCGEDAVPGLADRAEDAAAPLERRVAAVELLGRIGGEEAVRALVAALASGEVPRMRAARVALKAQGAAAVAPLLGAASEGDRLPEARCVLAGVAIEAGATGERVLPVVQACFAAAPGPTLQLMQLAPVAAFGDVIRANIDAARTRPEDAFAVLVAIAPPGDRDAVGPARAVGGGGGGARAGGARRP